MKRLPADSYNRDERAGVIITTTGFGWCGEEDTECLEGMAAYDRREEHLFVVALAVVFMCLLTVAILVF